MNVEIKTLARKHLEGLPVIHRDSGTPYDWKSVQIVGADGKGQLITRRDSGAIELVSVTTYVSNKANEYNKGGLPWADAHKKAYAEGNHGFETVFAD